MQDKLKVYVVEFFTHGKYGWSKAFCTRGAAERSAAKFIYEGCKDWGYQGGPTPEEEPVATVITNYVREQYLGVLLTWAEVAGESKDGALPFSVYVREMDLED